MPGPDSAKAEWTSSVRRPGDFASFWSETLVKTSHVPPDPEFRHVDMRSTPQVDVYDVRYSSFGGLRIAAWYCRPVGDGPFPGLLLLPGYVSEPMLPKLWALRGYAALSAAPRGKLRSSGTFNPGYPGLLTHNITDRDTYGYRGFYMDAVRAFDILRGRDEVDSARVGVHGGSQGGALALLTASLRAGQVTAAAAGAPFLCSMMDAASLTNWYPYQEMNDHLRLHPQDEPTIRQTLDYYDIHNFVDRIECPTIVNIGLRDDVCPPETGYAVFNQIGSSQKRLYAYEDCGHDSGQNVGHTAIVEEFLAAHLRPEAG